jgi:SAM-dependent methyltransferase
VALVEPRSEPNNDQAQYQAQYWNGPEAGHWLVHEHRYERMLAPFTRLVLDAAAVARTDRVFDIGCGTGSTTCTAVQAALEAHLTSDGVRLASRAWLVTACNPGERKGARSERAARACRPGIPTDLDIHAQSLRQRG